MNFDNIVASRKNKTIYRSGNLCVKVFNSDYSKANVLNEALNHARVEDSGLKNIPAIHEVTMIDGKWAIISDYIVGRPLSELMAEHPEKEDWFLNLFVDLQIKVQSYSCPLLSRLSDKMNRKICETDYDATTRYALHTRLDSMPKHNKLCHGDFNPSNIIITESGEPYIIDWAHATQGNASADVARTYLLFCLDGKNALGDKYVDLFCAKTKTDKRYVQSWIPIVAASQSVKGHEDEKEFLSKWVNVVDYE
ncbi:MAG: phosphotransferase [Firmicutes bacterium]|nr:phosphotransferase [Candidatus Colimorpha enterica]